MSFMSEFKSLKIPDTKINSNDFLCAYRVLTGRIVPVPERRELLVEYRFRYDDERRSWVGDKYDIYEQLKRNFHFDEKRYPDFESIIKDEEKGETKEIKPSKSTPRTTQIRNLIQSKKRVEPLSKIKNPYIKESKSDDLKEKEGKKVLKDKKRTKHKYTYEEEKMIIERNPSDKKIASMIGVAVKSVNMHRTDLHRRYGVNTIEDLDKKWAHETSKSDKKTDKKDIPFDMPPISDGILTQGEVESLIKQATKKTEEVKNEDTKNSSYVSSLIDKTMELMSDFEKLAKDLSGKERDIRTKSRYETLLKTLIKKDMQFFSLTAGNKAKEAQDAYLKSIGFTDVEIAYLRG